MTFTIDRATWANAATADRSTLHDTQTGMMCCLGQICHQTGTSYAKLTNLTDPEEVGMDIRSPRVRALLLNEHGGSSALSGRAMLLNDDPDLSKAQRERKLKALFRREGHELNFIGRSPRKLTPSPNKDTL